MQCFLIGSSLSQNINFLLDTDFEKHTHICFRAQMLILEQVLYFKSLQMRDAEV